MMASHGQIARTAHKRNGGLRWFVVKKARSNTNVGGGTEVISRTLPHREPPTRAIGAL